jgi:MEMO1 family protein
MELRPASLAGRWYPGKEDECRRALDAITTPEIEIEGAVGAIVPHAGWTYSGEIAFGAMKRVYKERSDADLVVLFGGHMSSRDLPRLFVEGGFATPLGALRSAEGLAQDVAMALPEADLENASEHYDDNGIEVILPMIKRLWPEAQVLAVGPPPTSAAISIGKEIVDLARRRGFKSPVLLGSTDLTHYGPNYHYEPKGRGHAGLAWVKNDNDPKLIAPMTALDPAEVIWIAERNNNACCAGSAAAAISGAKQLGAKRGVLTKYATSFDVRPSDPEPRSFVGYAGIVLGR